MGLLKRLFGSNKMTKQEIDEMVCKQTEQSSQICQCNHRWIEHNNHASITVDTGFTTDTRECHFCDCLRFTLQDNHEGGKNNG